MFQDPTLDVFYFTCMKFVNCANSAKSCENHVTNGVYIEFPKIQSDIYIQSKLSKYITI